MRNLLNGLRIAFLVALLACVFTGLAVACDDCEVVGHIDAEPSAQEDLDLGAWMYTLTLTWETGGNSIDYIMLFLDEIDQNCSCEDVRAAINFDLPAGQSAAGPDPDHHWHECDWEGRIKCINDPCLPDDGIYMKFNDYNCEHPGCCGGGTFTFFSDYPPTDVGMPDIFFKLGAYTDACSGTLTGVFPALPCDPTPDSASSWGKVKSIFR